MKKPLLSQKIQTIKAASNYQYKLIDSIYNIMSLKRKAQYDYQISLQGVNRELQKYIASQTGFLTDIIQSYQSYITVIYQNQKTLIEGYDNEILSFLKKAKDTQLQDTLVKKVNSVDEKVNQSREQISLYKRLIKQNYQEIQLVDSEFRLGQKFKPFTQEDKKKFANKYNDLLNLKKINQESLQMQIDNMMNIAVLHDQTLLQLQDYQHIYLQRKASDVFDNFMRAFVLEVSFIRSLQFDVGTILQKVKDRQEQQRKVVIQQLRNSMKKQKSKITSFLWDTYKKLTDSNGFDLTQHYISPRIRQKWTRVCDYYNKAY